MRYTLTKPMIITSRLMPGVVVGDSRISIEIIDRVDDGRVAYRYFIDTPDGELYSGDDIRSGIIAGNTVDDLIRKGTSVLLSFLSSEAERYGSTMGLRAPDDGWAFSAEVAEWAYLNSEEISEAALDLDGNSDL